MTPQESRQRLLSAYHTLFVLTPGGAATIVLEDLAFVCYESRTTLVVDDHGRVDTAAMAVNEGLRKALFHIRNAVKEGAALTTKASTPTPSHATSTVLEV